MQQKVNELLQQAILIYGMNVGSTAQWGVKNQKQPDLNTNYMYMQMAGHSYSHFRSCDKCPPSSFLLLSHIIQIKELRRPGAWLIFASTSFILILYSSFVGEELEMRSTLLG